MSSASWYARRLGQQQAPQPQQIQQNVMPTYQPVMAPNYQPQPVSDQPQGSASIEQMNQAIANGTWRGTAAVQRNSGQCPACHGPHYFQRAAEGVSRLPAPAPQCYECGYTGGLFTQGEQSNWVSP